MTPSTGRRGDPGTELAARPGRLSPAGAGAVAAVVLAFSATGYISGVLVSPLSRSRMFPWVVARSTGIGAFVALGAVVFLGVRFRRPSRRRPGRHRQTLLQFHSALVPALLVLVAAHVGSLLADRYSGVTWTALALPGAATYRPAAVAYGTLALYLLVVVGGSAALAGRAVVGSRWAGLHRLAYPTFWLVWLHGVLAGSDTSSLRLLYVVVGLAVCVAALPVLSRDHTPAGASR